MNVLYLGMADDITTPLLLVENIRTIFVIDDFDTAFSTDGTLEGQRHDIRRMLLNGKDAKREERFGVPIVAINPCTIIEDHYHFHQNLGHVWRVKFVHNNRKVKLVSFSRDFVKQVWPDEIQKVSRVMAMGAYDWTSLASDERNGNDANIKSMLATRTTNQYKYCSLSFSHFHGGIHYEIRSKAKEDDVEESEAENFSDDGGKIVEVSLLKGYPIENQLYPEDFSYNDYDHFDNHYHNKDDIETSKTVGSSFKF
jgi:hypothetical protein